jgi:diacylglycerol kinase (ATP)
LKVLVVLNGISRKKNLFYSRVHNTLREKFDLEIRETQFAGHAEELALQGAQEGFDVIFSAGGDGTMHQVVNGLMSYKGPRRPAIGLVPLGSGNDLARSMGTTLDANRLLTSLTRFQPVHIDIGLVQAHDAAGQPMIRYFINECSLGMGPEVVRRVNNGGRGLASGLMYTKAIVGTFFTLKPEEISVKADSLLWSGRSRVMAIANGKSFGHGIFIAPKASMRDGLLDLFIAGNPHWARFLLLLQKLKHPQQSNDKCLTYHKSAQVTVTSSKPLAVEADGEPVGFSPITCEIAKVSLPFLMTP